jgi:hypothetical protein
MGIALALSIATPFALYASLLCAVLALAGVVSGTLRRRPKTRWLAALLVSLLPALFLLLADLV